MDILDQTVRDIYFISPTSDQNVKLRKWRGLWLLKFKLLLKKGRNSMEFYSETSRMMFAFPVYRSTLYLAARLLEVSLSKNDVTGVSFKKDQFIEALALAQPPARIIEVAKVRSQFEFEGGWVEIADVEFPGFQTQTISIHSPRIEAVESALDKLRPDSRMEAMNYVQACRRWG